MPSPKARPTPASPSPAATASPARDLAFFTAPGTVTPGADYTAVSSNLTFVANEIGKTILISIATNVANESTETVNLVLNNVTGGVTLGTRSNAILNIVSAPDPNAIPAAGAAYLLATVIGLRVIPLMKRSIPSGRRSAR